MDKLFIIKSLLYEGCGALKTTITTYTSLEEKQHVFRNCYLKQLWKSFIMHFHLCIFYKTYSRLGCKITVKAYSTFKGFVNAGACKRL